MISTVLPVAITAMAAAPSFGDPPTHTNSRFRARITFPLDIFGSIDMPPVIGDDRAVISGHIGGIMYCRRRKFVVSDVIHSTELRYSQYASIPSEKLAGQIAETMEGP